MPIPAQLDANTYANEAETLSRLIETAALSRDARESITKRAARLIRDIRNAAHPGLMEVFLAEYGLSTREGVALMCLAEALLRVPDAATIDALIEDKIAPSDWGRHMGRSTSPLVNASTWALMLTGRVLDDPEPGLIGTLRGAVKRLGEPVIRTATARAMKEMGRQFVLGETIASAMSRAEKMEAKGYTYSYDMLGEAARTEEDATRYHLAYSRAITAIAEAEVPEGVEVSMRFDDEGQVSGQGGCNRYSGGYELAGDRLTIGPVAMTRMACPDEQMTTETRFGVAVGDVALAGIDETGALILSDAAGVRLIVALPATD